MAARMMTSVNTLASPDCCIISTRNASMYHRAGMTHDSHCSGSGILSMGKIMPDSNSTGIMNSMADTISADT